MSAALLACALSEAGSRRVQLDSERLDTIVGELDLNQAEELDRLMLWYRSVTATIGDWLERLTGGEDGWLNQFSDWLNGVFGSSAGASEQVGIFVFWLLVAAASILLGWVLHQIWRWSRPLPALLVGADPQLLGDPSLAAPLPTLPVERWAPALFLQSCLALAEQGRLILEPALTNQALVRRARVPAGSQSSLAALADAADRALFAGQLPTAAELAALRRYHAELSRLPTATRLS